MDEPLLPHSCAAFIQRIADLHRDRRGMHEAHRTSNRQRPSLSREDRSTVLTKTEGRCHICGGLVEKKWQADHVLAHSGGGTHSIDNYLAAHSLCNNYRWDYLPEEFQWILKIGVWAKTQIKNSTPLGKQLAESFFEYEVRREKRRRRKGFTASA